MSTVLTRSRIIDAAWEVLTADGLEAVSLRRIAGELDVTAPALYAHIEGKDDLLTAICDREFETLRASIEPPGDASAITAIEAIVSGYVKFALERPNAFQLLFQPQFDVENRQKGGVRESQTIELFEQTVETVRAAVEAGAFRAVDPRLTGFGLWSVAHGIARGIQLGYNEYEPDEIVSQIVETLANGLTPR